MRPIAWAAFIAGGVFLAAQAVLPIIHAVAKPASGGIVILLRGGMNIFSTGMDELAVKLHAAGIDARSVPHADWPKIATEARDRYAKSKRPFVLVGHSWGGLAAVLLAAELNKTGTPVDLMILYDPTQAVRVTPNVRHVINFTSSTGIGLGFTATGLKGFRGKIENIDVPEFGHLSMDNATPLHQRTVADILKVIRPGARKAD